MKRKVFSSFLIVLFVYFFCACTKDDSNDENGFYNDGYIKYKVVGIYNKKNIDIQETFSFYKNIYDSRLGNIYNYNEVFTHIGRCSKTGENFISMRIYLDTLYKYIDSPSDEIALSLVLPIGDNTKIMVSGRLSFLSFKLKNVIYDKNTSNLSGEFSINKKFANNDSLYFTGSFNVRLYKNEEVNL